MRTVELSVCTLTFLEEDIAHAHFRDGLTAGANDVDALFDAIRRAGDRNNVCGVSPIYLTLRYLQATRGEAFGYDQCPADDQGTSLVSVCGMTFD